MRARRAAFAIVPEPAWFSSRHYQQPSSAPKSRVAPRHFSFSTRASRISRRTRRSLQAVIPRPPLRPREICHPPPGIPIILLTNIAIACGAQVVPKGDTRQRHHRGWRKRRRCAQTDKWRLSAGLYRGMPAHAVDPAVKIWLSHHDLRFQHRARSTRTWSMCRYHATGARAAGCVRLSPFQRPEGIAAPRLQGRAGQW